MSKENKFNFTDERLRKIVSAEAGKRAYYNDEATTGLRLAVTATGTKTFQFQAWSPEKQRPITQTLGKWPAMPLQEARDKAISLLAVVRDGEDPEFDKKQRRETMTAGEMLDIYLEEHSKPHNRSWKDDEIKIRLYLKSTFGKMLVNEIKTESVRSWHAKTAKTVAKATANRRLALLRVAFNKVLPDIPNPCKSVKMYAEQSRERFLKPSEFGQFFLAVEAERTEGNPDVADYVLLSLHTGARQANVLGMRWKDIDFNLLHWRIPGGQSKNKTSMTIPIIDEALEILTRRRQTASSVFVLPGRGKSGHLQEPGKGWQRILKRAGLEDVRLHDLRRTMGSYQTISGASTAIVGKTLGHKNPASTAVYARMTLDPVREAMEKAVALMNQAAAMPVNEKVVNIKKG